jgi:hypothetical protein
MKEGREGEREERRKEGRKQARKEGRKEENPNTIQSSDSDLPSF